MQRSSRLWNYKTKLLTATTVLGAGGITYYLYGRNDSSSQTLNQTSFTSFRLIARDRVSDTSSILRLRSQDAAGPSAKKTSTVIEQLWTEGIWSIEIKQPQLMIARRYTPLPTFPAYGAGRASAPAPLAQDPSNDVEDISLLIRREPHGEVSRYLHNIPIDGSVEVRGGYPEYRMPDEVNEIVFLAGGTGIAPALQVAKCLQARGTDARLTVLWANRLRGDCVGGINAEPTMQHSATWSWGRWMKPAPAVVQELPQEQKALIVKQLDALSESVSEQAATTSASSKLRFDVHYFVDEEGTHLRQRDLDKAVTSRVKDTGQAVSGSKLVLVSGPDGFVDYVAGPKRLVNGIETQGPLGGLLSRADTSGWKVWKL